MLLKQKTATTSSKQIPLFPPILPSEPNNNKNLNTCQFSPTSLKRNNGNGTAGDDQQAHRPV